MRFGYGRVSTRDQHTEAQHDALLAAGVDPKNVFVEKASTRLAQRPKLEELRKVLRDGDTIVVTKVDRLARSLLDLITIADDLRKQGVTLEVLSGTFNRDDPMGEAFFQMTGVFAQLERDLIRQRTMRACRPRVPVAARADAGPSSPTPRPPRSGAVRGQGQDGRGDRRAVRHHPRERVPLRGQEGRVMTMATLDPGTRHLPRDRHDRRGQDRRGGGRRGRTSMTGSPSSARPTPSSRSTCHEMTEDELSAYGPIWDSPGTSPEDDF